MDLIQLLRSLRDSGKSAFTRLQVVRGIYGVWHWPPRWRPLFLFSALLQQVRDQIAKLGFGKRLADV